MNEGKKEREISFDWFVMCMQFQPGSYIPNVRNVFKRTDSNWSNESVLWFRWRKYVCMQGAEKEKRANQYADIPIKWAAFWISCIALWLIHFRWHTFMRMKCTATRFVQVRWLLCGGLRHFKHTKKLLLAVQLWQHLIKENTSIK